VELGIEQRLFDGGQTFVELSDHLFPFARVYASTGVAAATASPPISVRGGSGVVGVVEPGRGEFTIELDSVDVFPVLDIAHADEVLDNAYGGGVVVGRRFESVFVEEVLFVVGEGEGDEVFEGVRLHIGYTYVIGSVSILTGASK
jgi:hypothetical protein